MMSLIVLAIVVAGVAADASDFTAPIIKNSYEISPEGAFQFVYETGNGISAQAQGNVKNNGKDNPALEVQGNWRYPSPDGSPVELSYIANEYGYQPVSNSIPTPHPIPEYIVRALQYIEAHPPQEVSKGSAGRIAEPQITSKPFSGYSANAGAIASLLG